jgi:spore coat-associated protein N
MSGRFLKSAVVVGTAASFAALGAAADLADASRGRVQAKGPQLLLAGRNVQRARAVAPGDRIQRTLVLRVRERGELRIVALAVKAKRASLLTDRKQGLRLSLERCSRGWKGPRRAHSYTCRGRRTRLLTRKPVLGRRRLGLLLRRGQRAYLRLTLTLPTQAGNRLQGQTSTLVYRFTAVAQATR